MNFKALTAAFLLAGAPLFLAAQDADPLARCLELAGPPDAGVPANAATFQDALSDLAEARPFCTQAAEAEAADPAALFHVGAALQREGRHRDAVEALTRAAQGGLAAAETRLGDYYNFGIGPIRTDVDRAIGLYRSAAEKGDLPALATLALMARLGRGVPEDPAEMMRLMTEAADGGYHFAQYRLAESYFSGDGIPGGADAALGVPDLSRAEAYYRLAAQQDNAEAALALAAIYGGAGGATPDPFRQAIWTRAAINAGADEGLAALGRLYELGQGVGYDPARAAALYVEALESGTVNFDTMRAGPDGRIPFWDRQTAIEFQRILQGRGLYNTFIDGVVGPATRAGALALIP